MQGKGLAESGIARAARLLFACRAAPGVGSHGRRAPGLRVPQGAIGGLGGHTVSVPGLFHVQRPRLAERRVPRSRHPRHQP